MDIFITLFKSFGDANTYEKVVNTWRWKVWIYLFVLALISAVVPYIVLSRFFNDFCKNELPEIEKKVEKVKIEDWRVYTPDSKDIEFLDFNKNVIGVVTPNYVDAIKTKNLLFALEKDRITFYISDAEYPIFLKEIFPEEKNFSCEKLIDFAKKSFQVSLLPMTIIFAYFYNLFYVLILSFATLILSQTKMPNLGWIGAFKVSLVALTPAIFLDVAGLIVFKTQVPAFLLAMFSMLIIYRVLSKMKTPPENGEIEVSDFR